MKLLVAAIGGWLPTERHAWAALVVWLAVVLVYAVHRSRGDAKLDPIRPPGPILDAGEAAKGKKTGASGRN